MVMVFFIISSIVIIGVFFSMLNDEKKIVKRQEEKIRQLEKMLKEKEGINVNQIKQKQENVVINNEKQNIEQKQQVTTINEKSYIEEKSYLEDNNIDDLKNNAILITGSIFIVLAAIIFLTSTWSIIPNIIKTIILVALVAVFLGASKIAKNIFNLKQTSRAFYYIGMAYIPICLVSISVFKLFGNYLSLFGRGRYIYLFISSFITSFVYYVEFYKNKDKAMYISSLIMQFISVIFIMLAVKANILGVYIAMLLYNICVLLLSKDIETNVFTKIILGELSALSILQAVTDQITWHHVIILLEIVFTLIVYYCREKKYKKYYQPAIITLIILTGYCIIKNMNLSYHMYVIYSIAVYIISNLKHLEVLKAKSTTRYIAMIALGTTYFTLLITNFDVFINNAIYFVILLAIWIHSFIVEKNTDIKVAIEFIITATMYLVILSILHSLKLDILYKYVPAIATLLLMSVQIAYDEVEKEVSSIILQISEAIAFIVMIETNSMVSMIISIMLASCTIIVNKIILEKNETYDLLPFIGVLLRIITLNNFIIPNEVFLSIITVITLGIAFYKKNINVYTAISALYLVSTMAFIKNGYVNTMCFILWNILNAISVKKIQQKDIFKFLTYSGILYLYYIIIKDLKIEYSSVFSISLPIYAVIVLRTILNRYVKDIIPIEMTTFSIIYLLALPTYISELDGMIFVLCILGMIAFSYYKKIGSIFSISLAALIVNVFALTIDFWKSIPWWLYTLTIGIALISFAIYNETNKGKSVDAIKKIRDKLMLKE